MLTQVQARNAQGAVLSLPFGDYSNGFAVEEIRGLDPVKATIVSSSFANLDGAQYQSSRRETRNIVLSLGLEPDYVTKSVRDLRTQLYSFFMPKSEVNLRFSLSDADTVEITGRVESFESDLFTAEPSVDISILCFDPDFTELTAELLEGDTVSDSTDTTIEYNGTVETGIVFTLNVDRSLSEFTLYHKGPDNVLKSLDFAASLVSGDVLTISTISGQKSVTLLRSGVTSSILYGMSPQANWIELQPGTNYFRAYATGAAIPYTVTYTNRHGGL